MRRWAGPEVAGVAVGGGLGGAAGGMKAVGGAESRARAGPWAGEGGARCSGCGRGRARGRGCGRDGGGGRGHGTLTLVLSRSRPARVGGPCGWGRPGSSAARRPASRSDQQMVPEAGRCLGLVCRQEGRGLGALPRVPAPQVSPRVR